MELKPYHGYYGQIILYNTDGESFLDYPATCKSHIKDAIASYLFPEISKISINTNGDLDMDDMYTSIFVPRRISTAIFNRLNGIICQVEKIIGIDNSSIAKPITSDFSNALNVSIALRPNKWWFANPITVSAFYLIIRICCHTTDAPNDMNAILQLALSNKYLGKIPYGEASNLTLLAKAARRGNWIGLLESSLPPINRELYSDYMLNHHNRGFADFYTYGERNIPMKSLDVFNYVRNKSVSIK